jgi:drug/metabolite transporter (DMT)-like permease
LLALLGLGLLPTAIAHTLYFSSLSNLKSFETATMALLEPVGASLLGALLFQEVPAPVFVVGAVIVSLGIVFIGRSQNQPRLSSMRVEEGKHITAVSNLKNQG